eukprot:7145105-Karenia_brevis.AAC.1
MTVCTLCAAGLTLVSKEKGDSCEAGLGASSGTDSALASRHKTSRGHLLPPSALTASKSCRA